MPTTVTRRVTRCAALGAVTAGLLALNPVVVPQVAAAPAQAQQTYACVITVDENPGQPGNMDLTANITLNLPDQVAPGSQLSVDGNFSVQLPGEMGALFGAYFPSAQVTTDQVTLPVSVAGRDQLVRTSYIDSGTIDTRNPPVVFGGVFTTDPVDIPADATGDVTFSMPRNGSVPAISTDGMSAFTAVLVAQGGLVPGYDKGTDRVSCSSSSGESVPIGSVPITGSSAGSGGASPAVTGTGGAPAASAPSTNRVQDAQDAAGKNPEDDPAAAPVDADASDASEASAATRELADQMRLMTMNQAASREGGSYVPVSVIGWGTLGIVVASVLFTLVTNARTRRLKDAAPTLPGVDERW